MIADLPAELVKGIQMSDGPRQPVWPNDYYNDCLRTRLAPGEGDFDVHGFVTTLISTGCNIPWSLEVCNDDVWGHPGGEHAQRCADGMRAALVLAAAGS